MTKGTGAAVSTGALSGAAAGSAAGPWGAAIGAGAGALAAWIGNEYGAKMQDEEDQRQRTQQAIASVLGSGQKQGQVLEEKQAIQSRALARLLG